MIQKLETPVLSAQYYVDENFTLNSNSFFGFITPWPYAKKSEKTNKPMLLKRVSNKRKNAQVSRK